MAEITIEFIKSLLEWPCYNNIVDKSKLTEKNIRAAIKTLPQCYVYDDEGNYTCSEEILTTLSSNPNHLRHIANSEFIKKSESEASVPVVIKVVKTKI